MNLVNGWRLSLTKLFLTCRAERRASSACGTSAESKHPEDASLTKLYQGVLPKLISSEIILFLWIRKRGEIASVEFPDAWNRKHSRDLSTRPQSHSLPRTRSRRQREAFSIKPRHLEITQLPNSFDPFRFRQLFFDFHAAGLSTHHLFCQIDDA